MPKKIIKIIKNKQYVKIIFDNKIEINMRIHNASKTITKQLSLKYDTTVNKELLFTVKNYEY